MKPVVAIVGRPNVGKSTLFNRILGKHKAIVVDEPGVTRDLNYASVEELGRSFTLVDTGGFEIETEDSILRQVRDQTRLAVEDADVIIFLMDGKIGPTPQDEELVGMLRKAAKPVIFAANKVDSTRQDIGIGEFYTLGIEDIIPVSAEQGRGVNELIDAVIGNLPEAAAEEEEGERIKVAMVGRPNVGKSSLLNRLIGRQRSLVSPVAGTTRDPVDTPFDLDGKGYIFIDTAGIRKKNKVSLTVESYCVMEAIKSIDRCDCAILVLDAKAGIQGQDEKIAGLIEDRKKACIIVVNKWDILEKDTHTVEYVQETVRKRLPFISYAPVIFTSALTGQRVKKIFDAVDMVVEEGRKRISTSALNGVLKSITGRCRPPIYKGRGVKFYYITQAGTSPPAFVIFTNFPEGVTEPYRRYLTNGLREEIGFNNIPVRIFFRKRE